MKKSAFLLVLFVFFLLACTKGKDPVPVSMEVEYRLESSTSAMATEVSYTNETGGVTQLENAALPFSVKINRAPKPGVSLMTAYIHDDKGQPQSLTGTILVNGKVVETKTGSGTDAIVNLSYNHP